MSQEKEVRERQAQVLRDFIYAPTKHPGCEYIALDTILALLPDREEEVRLRGVLKKAKLLLLLLRPEEGLLSWEVTKSLLDATRSKINATLSAIDQALNPAPERRPK